MRRVDVRRAGGVGHYLVVLTLVFLPGCATVPPAEPPTTATERQPGMADAAPASVASTSSTRPPDTVPAPAPQPEQQPTSTTVTPSATTATTRVTPDVPTLPTTTGAGAAAAAEPDDDPVTAEPSGTQEVLVLDSLPHDSSAFTQGLVLDDGVFYESTGLYGSSTVRIVDPETGEVLASVSLDDRYFGEGLEVVDGRVVQLTWKEQTAFVWDAATLEPLGAYTYDGEGWGLCALEDRFVMSDGSSTLTFRDLYSFEVTGSVEVVYRGEPVDRLNELECVGDLVYANVWLSDGIVVIAAGSGEVLARVDASSLRGELSSSEGVDVLNGIAYDPDRRLFYLTGKLWPEIFEVRIGDGPGPASARQ